MKVKYSVDMGTVLLFFLNAKTKYCTHSIFHSNTQQKNMLYNTKNLQFALQLNYNSKIKNNFLVVNQMIKPIMGF